MAYKNVKHYRHTVHLYLDSIWPISSKPGQARTAMYKWLATQLNIDYYKCHVKWFTRDQCRQAIKILRNKQIQLYGKDLVYERWKEKMDKQEIEELTKDFSGSYWNYRWLKIIVSSPKLDENLKETGETEYENYYELHEVYYDSQEKPFMWTENPTRLQVDDANDLMDLIKKALNAAMEPVLLLTKNGDEDTVEEINEYIDGKEELTKWLMKKDEKNQK